MPKTDDLEGTLPETHWFKKLAFAAPLIAVLIIMGIVIWPILWIQWYDFQGFLFDGFVLTMHFLVAGVLLVNVLLLLLFAGILKLKKRSPRLLLAMTILPVMRAVPFVLFLHVMYWLMGLHSPMNVGERGKVILMEKAYKTAIEKDEFFNQNTFFGFTLGKDTLEEIEKNLCRDEVWYTCSYFDSKRKRLPTLNIQSWEPFSKLLNGPEWFSWAKLEFDQHNRLYKITVEYKGVVPIPIDPNSKLRGWRREEFEKSPFCRTETQIGLEEFRKYLSIVYKPVMQKAGFRQLNENRYFYTAFGARISFKDRENLFTISYVPVAESVEVLKATLEENNSLAEAKKEVMKLVK